MIHPERIKPLNSRAPVKGKYVLYWMQQSQRAHYNHALEYAIDCANRLSVPVVVYFGITPSFPEANERHYRFMLQGLAETERELKKRRIKLVLQLISPEQGVIELAGNASLLVADRGYLRIQREWREFAASRAACPMVQVESDVVVPVETASPKEEYSAGTFRPKLKRVLDSYLVPLDETLPLKSSLNMKFYSIEKIDINNLIKKLNLSSEVPGVSWIQGGTSKAKELLDTFISEKLKFYDTLRNDPSRDYLSHLSPYLHFGQVSPLYIALKVSRTNHSARESFLEEFIVRRELSMNFVFYNKNYDSYECLPEWAKKTLDEHRNDRREYIYTPEQFELSLTHDPYWNAAQTELRERGKMHGYMRMYWGKKFIEWTKNPEEAYRLALYLNNKYSIDGRDANGFTGVAWCFGKHDRAWKERNIFGKVRYMNDRGLLRKFDIKGYVERVAPY